MSGNIRIEDIDKNFKVETKIEKDDIKFYDAEEKPFRIYGVFKENGRYRRLPENVAKSVSDGVYRLHSNTAGGRIRFKTNSRYIAIHAEMDSENMGRMPHFALTGSIGFDMYIKKGIKQVFSKEFIPPIAISDTLEGIVEMDNADEKEITINMPLYSDVIKVYIGLEENAEIKEAPDYSLEKPVVFYGSSVTQGACASKAGSCYTTLLARRLDAAQINLGFSGNAKGEEIIARYIASLDMSLFVYDYDYNAPSVEHLQATHEPFFRIIREAQPELPVVMISRFSGTWGADADARRDVIRNTFLHAVQAGDHRVWFVDGHPLFGETDRDMCTVDTGHPTDIGFLRVADALEPLLRKILYGT